MRPVAGLRNPSARRLRRADQRAAGNGARRQGRIATVMKLARICAFALATVAIASLTFAAKNPIVGGKEMFPNKNIIENAVNSADHTTLVAAVKAAGLVDTLQGKGPFTVFAPTNAAFAKLPAGTVDTLLKPENKQALTKVLTYHVVAGRLSSMDLRKQIKAGKGTATLNTVSGGMLWAMMQGNDVVLKDEKGATATVTQANVFQSNGVIHVIDAVVLPQ
jgi:uncharacterized surface protein with fasciclin (FAS1) repeats